MAGDGFNSYKSTESFQDFCKSIGCETPLDQDFGQKCVLFFTKEKGKTQQEAQTLCYGVAQNRYQELLKNQEQDDDNQTNDNITEDNNYYKTDRSNEKRTIAKNAMAGYSPLGHKQKWNKGRNVDSFRIDGGRTPEALTYSDCVKRQIARGYPPEDAKKICGKIRLGVQDRRDSGVGGNITKQLKKYKGQPFIKKLNDMLDGMDDKELIDVLKNLVDTYNKDNPTKMYQVDMENITGESAKQHIKMLLSFNPKTESYETSLNDIFSDFDIMVEKKKKKKHANKKGFLGGFGAYYNINDPDSGETGE